ncbi:MAG: hypothetical protein FJW90_02530 [Actinobacteria bacterium]|nr:hypothetical protein [Actinomycetota bacterium]
MTRRPIAIAAAAGVIAALALSAMAPAAQFGQRPLKQGASGKDVRALQRNLAKLGHPTPVSGVYGPDTKRSVKALERRRSWPIDGKVSRRDAVRISKLASKRAKKPGTIFYVHGLTLPTVTLRAQSAGRAELEVTDARTGAVVAELGASFGSAGTGAKSWNGQASAGYYAPDSTYRIALADPGSARAAITGGQTKPFRLRLRTFPVPGPHGYGGAASRFGASRTGHTHQGQDMSAACGERLYVVEGGTVTTKAYQASGAGHYVVIHGAATGSDYVYMHMPKPTWAAKGQTVFTAQQIGKVGTTGSSTGCHLHFERWTAPGWYVGGRPYDPLSELLYWDKYS